MCTAQTNGTFYAHVKTFDQAGKPVLQVCDLSKFESESVSSLLLLDWAKRVPENRAIPRKRSAFSFHTAPALFLHYCCLRRATKSMLRGAKTTGSLDHGTFRRKALQLVYPWVHKCEWVNRLWEPEDFPMFRFCGARGGRLSAFEILFAPSSAFNTSLQSCSWYIRQQRQLALQPTLSCN